jgi:hypothetical protein
MAHHGDRHPGMSRKLREQLGLGATGDYPQGRLTPDDEGGLCIAIGARDGKVIVDFGKAVSWIGFDPQQALELAASIEKRAREILAEGK